MQIHVDSKPLNKALTKLHKCLTDNGAWFDDSIRVNAGEYGLSVDMNGPCNPGNIIMKVPTELLVPSVPLNMGLKGNDFVIDPDEDSLSPVQIELAQIMIEIYNLTDRPNFHKKENVFIRFQRKPELLELLMKARNINPAIEKRRQYMLGNDKDTDPGDFLCDTFLHTRVLGHKDSESNQRVQKIMPFVDYLNHHYLGSPFLTPQKENQPPILRIQNKQPLINRRELFACYGMYDALDTLLTYGFVDEMSGFVRSVPLDLSLDGTKKVIVKSIIGAKGKHPLNKQMKDLLRFTPALSRTEDQTLMLSHLFIPIESNPHALRRILRVIVRTEVKESASPQYVIDLTFRLEHMIVEKNIQFYRETLEKLEKVTDAPEDLLALAKQVCEVQLTKLYKYKYDREFFSRAAPVVQEQSQTPSQSQTQQDEQTGHHVSGDEESHPDDKEASSVSSSTTSPDAEENAA